MVRVADSIALKKIKRTQAQATEYYSLNTPKLIVAKEKKIIYIKEKYGMGTFGNTMSVG